MTETIASELIRVVDAAAERLRGMAGEAVTEKPAPNKWSKQEILGHLLDSAVNNHHRFVRAQQVDALTFPRYEQDDWVRLQGYNEASWPALIALWRGYNHHLAHVIRRIPVEKLEVVCTIVPYEPVTLGFLVEDYLVHLKHHLWQLTTP